MLLERDAPRRHCWRDCAGCCWIRSGGVTMAAKARRRWREVGIWNGSLGDGVLQLRTKAKV